MDTVIYDGSFENLFSAVFEIYEYKIKDPDIHIAGNANNSLFSIPHIVQPNKKKAIRVTRKLQEKLSPAAFNSIYRAFLSGMPGIENVLFRYIRYALQSKNSIERDFSNADVLIINQTAHKVDREKHRMKAFVRFQKTTDGLYYALIQPDFNVLPLISDHFEKRYADQSWLIYDVLRKYGLYYNLREVNEVTIDFAEPVNSPAPVQTILDAGEALYQALWQSYFDSVNIKARKNSKLHIRHMPKRYWKYLVEKLPSKNNQI